MNYVGFNVREVKRKTCAADRGGEEQERSLGLAAINCGESKDEQIAEYSYQRNRHAMKTRVLTAIHQIAVERLPKIAE